MKLGEIFEPGHRKTTMTLIALVGSILLEKYGGGISGDLKEIILSILAIFTGGNVLSKGIQAARDIKGQQKQVVDIVEDIIEDVKQPPQEQQSGVTIQQIVDHVNKLDQVAGAELKALKEAVAETNASVQSVSDRLDVQVKNLSQVLTIINGLRNGNTQQQA